MPERPKDKPVNREWQDDDIHNQVQALFAEVAPEVLNFHEDASAVKLYSMNPTTFGRLGFGSDPQQRRLWTVGRTWKGKPTIRNRIRRELIRRGVFTLDELEAILYDILGQNPHDSKQQRIVRARALRELRFLLRHGELEVVDPGTPVSSVQDRIEAEPDWPLLEQWLLAPPGSLKGLTKRSGFGRTLVPKHVGPMWIAERLKARPSFDDVPLEAIRQALKRIKQRRGGLKRARRALMRRSRYKYALQVSGTGKGEHYE